MDAFPNYNGGTALAASPSNDTFTWNGIQWTWDLIQMRLVWVFVALSVSLFAAIWFSRFDPAREWPRQSDKRSVLAKREESVTAATTRVSLTPLTRTSSGPQFGFLLLSELRLILKGIPWWWYFIAGSLSVLSLFVSLETVKALLLPLAWIWPLLIWSELGNREIRHQTSQIVFSSAHPLRYLSVQWLAGVLVALLTAGGMALRFLSAGKWLNFATLIISACFIPALALALGVWTSGSRSFEVAYLTMWYLGPINHLPQLDYVGTMNSALVLQKPHYYLLATIVMLGLALIGRKRELRV